jgi:hypothetical protein
MTGACLSAERHSTGARLAIVRRHTGLRFRRQSILRRLRQGSVALRSGLGRVFALDGLRSQRVGECGGVAAKPMDVVSSRAPLPVPQHFVYT